MTLAAQAQALKARYPGLLIGDDCGHVYKRYADLGRCCTRCGYHEITCAETVCSGVDGDIGERRDKTAENALDAARERLQGTAGVDPSQLRFDLGRRS